MSANRIAALVALVLLAPLALGAQQQSRMAAPGRTIVGVVVDSADRIVDSAEVFIPALKRSTAADTLGRFRFTDVKPGEYEVAARRLGYYPQTRSVSVTRDSGGVARFVLVPHTRGLTPVVTNARRGGLSGVVGDTAWNAVKDAVITVVSSSRQTVSDSMGAFYFDLQPGRHMIRVKRDGYASQMVSVTVPRDSGRRVMVFLAPGRQSSVVEEQAILEMEMRFARKTATYSAFITREDLNKGPWTELMQVAEYGAGRPLDPACLAWVDGGPKREYIWAIRASEIEAVEVYRARPQRAEVRAIVGGGRPIGNSRPLMGPPGAGGRSTECQDELFVWLRK
jgi:hypothetical protein